SLPSEPAWYGERGITAEYIGHPFFDELPRQELELEFILAQRATPGTIIGLLPGSRTQEVERNLSTLVRAAGRIHAAQPDTRFLVACYRRAHQQRIADYLRRRGAAPIEPCVGRTPEIIHLAHACIAVSGSVGLELLYRSKPSVVLYRIGRLDLKVGNFFKKCRFISLVNLLADKELFPEYLTDRCESGAISEHVLRWLNDATAYEGLCRE